MNIMILGAFGKSGQKLIHEANSRGHEIIGVAHRNHSEIHLPIKKLLLKSSTDLNAEDIKDCDVIIDAISAWVEETFPIHNKTFYHISRLIENTDKHYIKIGGTGTMFIKKNHHQQLKDWEDFPDELKPLANVLVDNLNYIRTFSNLNWTYVSPAFQYEYELPSVNHYHVKGEYYPVDQLIETKISYTDFARALIDIAENRSYFRQRIFICE